MRNDFRIFGSAFLLGMALFMVGCGVAKYPGQPGMAVNGFAKMDLENLDGEGLWVYEVVYDNRIGGKGVAAIVTKLYPGAQTYTSNVRTNADGTLYFHKAQAQGAEVQAIALPATGQLHLNPNHKIQFMLEYTTSFNEVDDKNVAEDDIFKFKGLSPLSPAARKRLKTRWDALRAGSLTRAGTLSYQVTALEMGSKKLSPATPVQVETSFHQNAFRTNLSAAGKRELAEFLEANFPKGYKGPVKFSVAGAPAPLEIEMGVHTLKTLQASGTRITYDAGEALLKTISERFIAKSAH